MGMSTWTPFGIIFPLPERKLRLSIYLSSLSRNSTTLGFDFWFKVMFDFNRYFFSYSFLPYYTPYPGNYPIQFLLSLLNTISSIAFLPIIGTLASRLMLSFITISRYFIPFNSFWFGNLSLPLKISNCSWYAFSLKHVLKIEWFDLYVRVDFNYLYVLVSNNRVFAWKNTIYPLFSDNNNCVQKIENILVSTPQIQLFCNV